MKLRKYNYIIVVSEDLKDKYPANKIAELFNAVMLEAKGGGNNRQAKGIYYDTEDSEFFNKFSELLKEVL